MEITDEESSTSPAYGPAPSPEPDDGPAAGTPTEPSSRTGSGAETGPRSGTGSADDQVVHICKRCMTSRSDPDGECPECGDTLLPIRSTSDSYLGQRVGEKYKLVEQIGSGGMGEVYLGVNEPLDQRVAVKFLNQEYAANEQIIMRFLNEARSYCRVNHPNAVTLLDYGQHDGGALYLITEFVDGLSLTDAVEAHGALAPEQAISVVMQCCEVLSSAHGEGVIHRDLKPDNLMLIPAGEGRYEVKVLDFGIAKIVDDEGPALTETGSVFGTPEFMSPEQAEGKAAGPRSDVYALGIILFYASTGRLPFDADSQYAVLEKQIHEEPPGASSVRDDLEVPPAIEEVIEKSLRKDRGLRYGTAEEMYEQLEGALEEIRRAGKGSGGDSAGAESWGESAVDHVDLTERIENSAEIRAGGYPAGEGDVDSRAETASGPRGVGREPNRFGVGGRLRSIDLSREEPRDHGMTVSTARGVPWRRAGMVATVLFVASLAGWQIWSTMERPGGNHPRSETVVAEAEQAARRKLSATHAALDAADVESARRRVERAASELSPEMRDPAMVEMFAVSRMRLRDVEEAAEEFGRALEAGRCGSAERVGEEFVRLAPDVAARVAARLNECGESREREEKEEEERSRGSTGRADRGDSRSEGESQEESRTRERAGGEKSKGSGEAAATGGEAATSAAESGEDRESEEPDPPVASRETSGERGDATREAPESQERSGSERSGGSTGSKVADEDGESSEGATSDEGDLPDGMALPPDEL